ncbi:hypothetical protein K661_01090 [Piscirickettsia salmonis LF-89 = ATCC VR-1361]|nr:hypothetical protein K661_01090 [Piscirickettsia salmonis LF-89 = ATCC VR-1361]
MPVHALIIVSFKNYSSPDCPSPSINPLKVKLKRAIEAAKTLFFLHVQQKSL